MTEEEINRNIFWIKANGIVRKTGKDNHAEAKIVVDEKWDIKFLEENLDDEVDKEVLKFLTYGWPINATDTELQTKVPPNQAAARENEEFLKKYVKEQRQAGTVIGPFKRSPFGKHTRISPIDTRVKKDSED